MRGGITNIYGTVPSNVMSEARRIDSNVAMIPASSQRGRVARTG